MESVLCTNCGSASGCMVLEDEEILNCIQQWTVSRLVQSHDLICETCWKKATATISNLNISHVDRTCCLCNVTLLNRARSHQLLALRTDTVHYNNIKNIILEKLSPIPIHASHYICHPCWQKADRAAKRFSNSSTSMATNNKIKCVNCLIDLTRLQRHILNNDIILAEVQQRVAPQVVTATDYICNACYTLFDNMDSKIPESFVGHRNICIRCGRSVAQLRHSIVQAEQNQHILSVIQNWIQPREIQSSDVICHRCFQRAETVFRANAISATVPLPQQPDRINLPNYSRAPDTHSRCIFPNCNSTSQQVVPFFIRVRLFSDHKYYIPSNCRICRHHLIRQEWTLLFEAKNINNCFTASHIEDFCELLKYDKNTVDFENIEED